MHFSISAVSAPLREKLTIPVTHKSRAPFDRETRLSVIVIEETSEVHLDSLALAMAQSLSHCGVFCIRAGGIQRHVGLHLVS